MEKRKTSSNKDFERRFQVTELRAVADEKGIRHITGYAAVFNTLSEDLGWFREKIEPGAFKETILQDDIRALKNHNSDYVLGRNKSGTLTLSEDDRGLKVDIAPSEAQWVRDLMMSIDRGDTDQMSFGFQTLSDRWEMVDKQEIRTLVKVKLFDVSTVTFPAYPDTEVGLRSLEAWRKQSGEDAGNKGTADPLTMHGLLAEEDQLYKQICGL